MQHGSGDPVANKHAVSFIISLADVQGDTFFGGFGGSDRFRYSFQDGKALIRVATPVKAVEYAQSGRQRGGQGNDNQYDGNDHRC